MYTQSKVGIYVYFTYTVRASIYDAGHKKIGFYYFETLENFFKKYSEFSIAVSFSSFEKIYYRPSPGYYSERSFHAAYDQDGKFYSPDRLVGLYREWVKARVYNSWWKRRNGRKKSAYGRYHLPKVVNEYKNTFDDPWAKEEGIRVDFRKRWNSAYGYDDYGYTHNDKSWKTQSKRKHQYK